MRSGDDERTPAGQKALAQRAGHRFAAQAEAFDLLRLGVVAPNGIADDDPVGPRLEVCGLVPAQATDAQPLEHGTDRRVERHVRAANVVTRLAQERGESTHSGAGCAYQVNVHAPPAEREGRFMIIPWRR